MSLSLSLVVLMALRPISLLALPVVLVVALTGCSSSGNVTAGPATSTSSSSEPSPDGSSESATPSGTESSSSTESSGTGSGATDFCDSISGLSDVDESTDPAVMGRAFRDAAADMRATAPDEIKDAVETYAILMDYLGQIAESGTYTDTSMAQAMGEKLQGRAEDITTVTLWAAKNCS